MPTKPGSGRSLLVLALVANLFAASAPLDAYGRQRESDSVRPEILSGVPPADAGAARRSAPVRPARDSSPTHVPVRGEWTGRPKPAVPQPRPRAESKPDRTAARTSFRGRNHVWIPALGINRSVAGYACSSSAYPGNRVYRWGCAGSNNVYLFGHAHSVFRALHDAYVGGRLKKGIKVYYADAAGRVGTYAVSWWKVTTPDKGAWAYASQPRPSLTLQTCVGAKSQYRLIVRLSKVG